MGTNEQIEGIRKRIRKEADIVITRVPAKTKDVFMQFAKDDFAGDYGMCLKHLLDFYTGLIPTGWEHLEFEIENLKQRLEQVEGTLNAEEKTVRTMLNGRSVNRK